MLSPVRMERLDALVLGADARGALRGLGELGAVEPIPTADADAGAVAACAAFLERLASLRGRLGAAGEPRSACAAEVAGFEAAQASLADLEARAEEPLRRRDALLEEVRRAEIEHDALAPFAGLPLPSDAAGGLRLLCYRAGSVPADRFADLGPALGGDAVVVGLPERAGRRFLVALCAPPGAVEVEDALEASGFKPANVPARPGATLGDLAAERAEALRRAREDLSAAQEAVRALAAAAPLEALERAAREELALLEAGRCLARTEGAALLSGWVPAPEAGAALERLRQSTGGRLATQTSVATGEAPVLLRPPRLLRPFAALVTTYAVPRYGEIDPTGVAAVTFLFMFGMMFGDVGHGAVLAAAGLALALRSRSASLRDGGRILVACGLSSMAFGALYGSCFGIEALKRWALWRDPLEGDPTTLLLVAAGAGVAVVSLGILLHVANRLRSGDRLGAALGRFGVAGLAFYWGAVALVAGKAPARVVLPIVLAAAACWVVEAPARHLLARRRGEPADEGLGAAVAESAVGAFEGVLLYLSNTVSFVRLAAYAMSHAALLASAWILAEAADEAWGEGSALGLAAVVLGNAAALGLEGVVAAVQAVRLEYYEFFGKFFEGGGRPFRPFSLPAAGGDT